MREIRDVNPKLSRFFFGGGEEIFEKKKKKITQRTI